MRTRRICKRCHRLRPLNAAGYCASGSCAEELEALRKPRRRRAPEEKPDNDEELSKAPTDPAPTPPIDPEATPDDDGQDRDTVVEVPHGAEGASPGTAVEGGPPDDDDAATDEEKGAPHEPVQEA